MTQLTIPITELRRLAGIDASDTSQDAALAQVQAAEQEAAEYALDPAALAAAPSDDGLRATLTLGVAEILAGSFLGQQARAPGAGDDIRFGDVALSPSRTQGAVQIGEALTQRGAARLAPYRRASLTVGGGTSLTVDTPPDSGAVSVQIAPSVFDGGCGDAPIDCCPEDLP